MLHVCNKYWTEKHKDIFYTADLKILQQNEDAEINSNFGN